MMAALKQKSIWNTRSASLGLCVVLLAAGCSTAIKPTPIAERAPNVTPFSAADMTTPLPSDWQPWILSRFNAKTQYSVVEKDGRKVLQARADKSASGILQELSVDPIRFPVLRWQWKLSQALPAADLTRKGTDDSPARVIVSFDGDMEKLDVEDRAMARMVKLFSGREMPYATIMYVWDNKLPPDTMLDNAHSTRAKMIVVDTGDKGVGQWSTFSRDIASDFQRAFGEAPGRVISVGVMTDTNGTDSVATTYYSDIALLPKPVTTAQTR
jgi:hypothetical protein